MVGSLQNKTRMKKRYSLTLKKRNYGQKSFMTFATGCTWLHPGNTKGGSITVPLTSCLTALESAVGQPTIFICFYLQNRLLQTGQTGGQWYSDTYPL